ncbi:MAG: hypothetical protein HY897_11210 [Deltaproteobacteria bacterium]|nr:hypothetical protein [Deltaproteobacteria bacterium]
METPSHLVFLIPVAAFLVFGPAIWIFVCVVLSVLGGWRALAQVYRSTLPPSFPPPRNLWKFQSARFRWGTNYNGILTVGADDAGLHLSVFFLFKAGHPPLLIPWRDITAVAYRGLLFSGRTLSFARAPGVTITVREPLARSIAAAAGAAWPGRG